MPISNAEGPQICLLPHKPGPSKVFKAQFSNLAEPPKMRWLGHRGTKELLAPGLHMQGPSDSGVGHAACPRGKHLVQMSSHQFDGSTKLLCLAISSAASLLLRDCYGTAPDAHRKNSTEISDLQSGL